MKRLSTVFVLLVIVSLLAISCSPAPAQAPNVLVSIKAASAPALDGQAESVWNKAKAVSIPVSGGLNSSATTVTLKSVYTSDSVYFLAEWADPTNSVRRMPWEKQADGSWKKLATSTTHQESTYYEDKMAMIWNINDSIAGFNQQGCMVTCHAGEKPANSAFGSKYTASAGEIGDIWHWKGVRNGPVDQIDDQYVDNTRYDAKSAPEAGRKSDAKTGGGYVDNQTADKKLPAFALPGNKPAPTYWIKDSEKVAFDDSKYKAGDEVPGIIVAPFTGDRGDISAKSVYANGKWTLEWGRKLNTGSKTDVQFSDLAKSYFFGVAVFDNTQVDHAFSSGGYELKFAR